MIQEVKITKTETMALADFWLMRGVKVVGHNEFNGAEIKKVITEKEMRHMPQAEEIAQFLADSKADFMTLEHNYRLEEALPFF